MNLLSKPIYILEITARQQQEITKAILANKGDISEIILKNSTSTSLQGKHIQKLVRQQLFELQMHPYILLQKYFMLWFNSLKYPKGD